MPDTGAPKTQTHSATTVDFGLFSPNESALWRPHPLDSRPRRPQSGGIALHGGSTRRRHAARRLRVVQNPHRHQPDVRRVTYKYWAQGRLARKTRPTPPLQWHFREKTRPASAKTPNLGHFERAGRTFSRFHDLTATQGELFRACRRRPSSALPISTPGPTGVEGARGSKRPGRGTGCGAGCGRLAEPTQVRRATARQISHIIPHGHFSRPPENGAIPTI